MDIAGAIKSAATLTSQWLTRIWGTQTSDQAAIERDITHAKEQKSIAFEALKNARTDDAIRDALTLVNYWDDRLTRLHNEATAKWP